MLLIVNKYLFRKIRGISIWPFVFIKDREDSKDLVLINHERIHLKQQLELFLFPFYLWYIIEFIIRYVQSNDYQRAYRTISFEREAYAHESDLKYCQARKPWSFLRYLNLK